MNKCCRFLLLGCLVNEIIFCLHIYYAPAVGVGGALSDAAIRLSVPPGYRRGTADLGQLGAQRLGQLCHSCPVGHQSCVDSSTH